MIQVIIGSNTNRKSVLVDPNTTIREVLETNGIDYSVGGIHLDGLSIGGSELDDTFAERGVSEKCMLISVVKSDGGARL